VAGRGYREFPQIYPAPGLVEHDPEAIWASVLGAMGDALAHTPGGAARVAAIGITNQRETTLLWERATGNPVAHAIVWQDRRTAPMCAALKNTGAEAKVRAQTGLVIDPYFSATKIRWLLEHVPGLEARATRGEIAFGTVDSYLVHRLTARALHATDPSNASRTLLYDIHAMSWSEELGDLFGVPGAMLPEVRDSLGSFGATRSVPGLPDGIPIAGIAGDQQAALFGQGCFSAGAAKCTYGTGSFLLLNVGAKPVPSRHGLVTTVAWRAAGQPPAFALEGSSFVAGALVQWLRDGLGIISRADEVEGLARSVPDSGGVVIVPALAGLGAPHWKPDARGLVTGITRGTTRGHIARAALEAIALQNLDLVRAMEADAGRPLDSLRVDGGAAANDLLLEIQSGLLGIEVTRPAMLESTALGAARLAARGAGVWEERPRTDAARRFAPAMSENVRRDLLDRWQHAVAKA